MYARFWHFQTFSFLVIDALAQLNPSRLGYTVSLVQCMSKLLPVIAKIPRKKDCSNIYIFLQDIVWRTTISLASSSNVITFSSNSKSGCRLWPASDSLLHDLAKTILYVPVFKLPWWLSVSFKFIFSSDLAKGCLWNPIRSIDLLYNQSNTCFL